MDPENIGVNTTPPPVAIKKILVDGQPIDPNIDASLAPGSGSVKIWYTALSFAAPERLRFKYRLDGYQRTWVQAGSERFAEYTNLPPGHYSFHVMACNEDGIWNEIGATVSFDLRPHFYQTIWFYALCVILAVVPVVLFVQIRARQLVSRARQLEAKVAERTAELATANRDLRDAKDEVEAQNEELVSVKVEIESRNQELERVQSELKSQNSELLHAQAILADANQLLETLATIDGLTGIKNHRAFQEQLELDWKRHNRSATPLSLILLDVDRFKTYNDAFGHPKGDTILQRVGEVLMENAREGDFVARYGGEEFVVIAPDTSAVGAVALAERLRLSLEAVQWPLRPITASFGVATSDLSITSAGELISAADRALYRSKDSGRNTVSHIRDAEPAEV